MRVYLPAFYSLELFCLPGNILGFHFAIARASNDFHSRNLIIILLSLFYIQYILWKECLLCNGCNAILFKVTVRYQALQLQLGLMVTPMLEDWCEVFFFCFFFGVVVEDCYCERLKRYPVWALILWGFLKLKWRKEDTFSCGTYSVAIVFNSLTFRISFCWCFCLFQDSLTLYAFYCRSAHM